MKLLVKLALVVIVVVIAWWLSSRERAHDTSSPATNSPSITAVDPQVGAAEPLESESREVAPVQATRQSDEQVAASSPLPPHAENEQRDIEVDVPTLPDLLLFCRLVDAETSKPIGDGAVWFDHSGDFIPDEEGDPRDPEAHDPRDEIPVRVDGTFEVHAKSWKERFISAKAPGYARVAIALMPGHESAARRLEMRLSRAATLEVVVFARGSAASNAAVVLSTLSYYLQQGDASVHSYGGDDPQWRATTDASGRAVIAGLPAQVPLTLSVQMGNSTRAPPDPVVLAAGERKQIEFEFGSGATIAGRIQDGAGAPIVACPIWRVVARGVSPMLITGDDEAAQTVVSDEQGRFRFEDVPEGEWLIGSPANPEEDVDLEDHEAFAGLAQWVKVEADARELTIVLQVDRGLYLSGVVLDPTGAATSDASLTVRAIAGLFLSNEPNAQGHFAFGPLPAGTYDIHADGGARSFAPSDSAQVKAGDSDIVLRFTRGGSIVGRVIDATGKPADCQLTLVRADPVEEIPRSARGGNFRFDGLHPGSYSLRATTKEGLCGRRWEVTLVADQTIDDVVISLSPGARVKLVNDGKEDVGAYQLLFENHLWASKRIERDVPEEVIVPSGDIEVRWYNADLTLAGSQRITLAPGELREALRSKSQ